MWLGVTLAAARPAGVLIRALFPATESQQIFTSPGWLKIRGAGAGQYPSDNFGFGYAELGNMCADTTAGARSINALGLPVAGIPRSVRPVCPSRTREPPVFLFVRSRFCVLVS